MVITGKEAKALLKSRNDALIKQAQKLAREHIAGFHYTITRAGAIGVYIMLEHPYNAEILRAHVWLKPHEAAIGGGIYHENRQIAQVFIAMLQQLVAICRAYEIDLADKPEVQHD
jgi:hypothetical protein